MKTKKILFYLAPLVIAGVLASCSSSNKVAGNFGKRKYNKGFFFDRPSKPTDPAVNTANAKLQNVNTTVASAPVVTLQKPAVASSTVVPQKNISANTNQTASSSKKVNSEISINSINKTVAANNSNNQTTDGKIQASENSVTNVGDYHSGGGGGGGSCKNWIVCLLLCWLLGEIGIHRFYMGYTWQGVVQLLTFGGCGIWTLIDFIRIIMKSLKPKNGDYCE